MALDNLLRLSEIFWLNSRCPCSTYSLYSGPRLGGITRGRLELRSPVQMVRSEAYRLLASQCVLLILASGLTALMVDNKSALSVALGGLCALVPQLIFVWKFFKQGGASAIKAILGSFYWGELLKLVLIGALTVISWKVFKPTPLYFLTGLILVPLGVFLTPFLKKR